MFSELVDELRALESTAIVAVNAANQAATDASTAFTAAVQADSDTADAATARDVPLAVTKKDAANAALTLANSHKGVASDANDVANANQTSAESLVYNYLAPFELAAREAAGNVSLAAQELSSALPAFNASFYSFLAIAPANLLTDEFPMEYELLNSTQELAANMTVDALLAAELAVNCTDEYYDFFVAETKGLSDQAVALRGSVPFVRRLAVHLPSVASGLMSYGLTFASSNQIESSELAASNDLARLAQAAEYYANLTRDASAADVGGVDGTSLEIPSVF